MKMCRSKTWNTFFIEKIFHIILSYDKQLCSRLHGTINGLSVKIKNLVYEIKKNQNHQIDINVRKHSGNLVFDLFFLIILIIFIYYFSRWSFVFLLQSVNDNLETTFRVMRVLAWRFNWHRICTKVLNVNNR